MKDALGECVGFKTRTSQMKEKAQPKSRQVDVLPLKPNFANASDP